MDTLRAPDARDALQLAAKLGAVGDHLGEFVDDNEQIRGKGGRGGRLGHVQALLAVIDNVFWCPVSVLSDLPPLESQS
jgi:hypothetical protein